MPSQKSNSNPAEPARAPKRERGHLRVAAILDAGAEVFAEKGYQAATMTEIAARADTAIGSLYRFFPSKEVLADALLDRYAQQVVAALTELRERAAGMDSATLAERLVQFMLALQDKRQFVLVILDAREGSRRLAFRAAMRDGMANVLLTAMPALTPDKAEAMAPVLIAVLKNVTTLAFAESDAGQSYLAELHDMLRAYLQQATRT